MSIGTEVIYLYLTHKVETKMLAVHTNSMCPLVRQVVGMTRGLGVHISLWKGSRYCV